MYDRERERGLCVARTELPACMPAAAAAAAAYSLRVSRVIRLALMPAHYDAVLLREG